MAEFMGTKSAAEKWGYPQWKISRWCRENLIPGVEQDKKGSPWRIPVDAKCPESIKKGKIRKGNIQ